MFYNNQPSPTSKWPSTVQYSNYQPNQRSKLIWFLVLAIVLLTLSVAALIIVFAVEHSWFSDNFNQTTNNYGLWRLCFYLNQTCDSWFSTNGPNSNYIEQRLNQNRVGINAWQALEIVFLFLTTSTLLIALASIICYRLRKNIHYYLAILAAFSVWPAAIIGVSALFVFGFSVYNVSVAPRKLEWCFYVNLVAVILLIISAILLTIYDILLKRPMKNDRDDGIIDPFADVNGYSPTVNPSTFVVVRRNKKKRKEPYDYPQILYPHQYQPPSTINNNVNTDYITNPNHQMLAPYGSLTSNQQKNPSIQQPQQSLNPYRGSALLTSPSGPSVSPQAQFYQPSISSYPYQTPHWQRTGLNSINYNNESANSYIQRGIYRPTRLHPIEPTFEQREEPRVLHYYTGYDHFSTIDPNDVALTRHHPSLYTPNPSYYQQNDYVKSVF